MLLLQLYVDYFHAFYELRRDRMCFLVALKNGEDVFLKLVFFLFNFFLTLKLRVEWDILLL